MQNIRGMQLVTQILPAVAIFLKNLEYHQLYIQVKIKRPQKIKLNQEFNILIQVTQSNLFKERKIQTVIKVQLIHCN